MNFQSQMQTLSLLPNPNPPSLLALLLKYENLILATFALFSLFQLYLFSQARRFYPHIFSDNSKPISWLLTWLLGLVVIPASIPFTYSLMLKQDLRFASNSFAHIIASAFLSFLVMDLVLGVLYYPKKLQFLAGWIHHLLYIAIVLDFLRHGIPGLLGTFCLLEVPTFIMSLGNLNHNWRQDTLFGILFFATRIFYHALIIYHFAHWLPYTKFFAYSALAFPLHCWWGWRWLVTYRKIGGKATI